MNVEIGTEAPIFLFWEHLFLIFGILSLQCGRYVSYIDRFFTLLLRADMVLKYVAQSSGEPW